MEAKFEAVHAELAPEFTGRLKATPENYRARGALVLTLAVDQPLGVGHELSRNEYLPAVIGP
jgi:hypothetical protein